MICPFALYRPVGNHGGRMTAVNGLCLHVQVGNGSLYNYFNSPSSGVSAHFWSGKNGVLEQYVDTDLIAWAQAAGNPYYLSVETEGFPNEPLNNNQLTMVARLLQWSATNYNFPMVGPTAHGSRGFTQHCNPNGTPDPAWGNHSCPDPIRMAQMPTITTLANPTPPPFKQGAEDDMDSLKLDDGTIVSHFRTPANHYIEVTRKAGTAGQAMTGANTSIIDLTQQWPQFESAG